MATIKRDAELMQPRHGKSRDHVQVDTEELPPEVNTSPTPPAANPDWHPVATALYESIKTSPARMFMYDLDWAWAYTLAESLSRDLKPQVVGITERRYDTDSEEWVDPEAIYAAIPLKGASLNAYIKAFGSLGATEADRLRMQLEVPPIASRKLEEHSSTPDGVVKSITEAREARLG